MEHYRELYNLITSYEGSRLYADILSPHVDAARRLLARPEADILTHISSPNESGQSLSLALRLSTGADIPSCDATDEKCRE
jgi:hypothetical protein